MANDGDWVADVRRWYFSTQKAPTAGTGPIDSSELPLGYEAAHPALQSPGWPDAPRANTEPGALS